MTMRFAPSILHPASWWLLGVSMVISATLSRNFVLLISISLIAIGLMVASEKTYKVEATRPGLGFYLALATLVLSSRILFRLIFNTSSSSTDAVLVLPVIELNLGFGDPVQLLGTISETSLIAATVDGLRLAAIILSIGLAVTLANPRKLLRSTPSVLYEIAASVSIAINLAPQIVKSIQRVKAARKLRGASATAHSLVRNVIPVLEDSIESSMRLAASMSSRGFGQQQKPAVRFATASLSLAAVICFAVGSFLVTLLGIQFALLIALGLVFAVSAIIFSAKNSHRTRLIVDPVSSKDLFVVFGSVCIVAVSAFWMSA